MVEDQAIQANKVTGETSAQTPARASATKRELMREYVSRGKPEKLRRPLSGRNLGVKGCPKTQKKISAPEVWARVRVEQ